MCELQQPASYLHTTSVETSQAMMRIVITLAMLACVFASNEYYEPEERQQKQADRIYYQPEERAQTNKEG